MRTAILAFGANKRGPWGAPEETIRRAVGLLARAGIATRCLSLLYTTAPVGRVSSQDRFVNAVGVFASRLGPRAMLLLLKRLERQAGRGVGVVGGPRSLDIDIVDVAGQSVGWKRGRRKGRLTLPHPEAHRRLFVLRPLLDVAPRWRHPKLRVSARQLARDAARRGRVDRDVVALGAGKRLGRLLPPIGVRCSAAT